MTEHDPWTLSPAQRRDLLASLSDDYALGFELGVHHSWTTAYTAGWQACEDDVANAWAAAAADVRARASDRSHAELVEQRATIDYQPCPRQCRRCSTCIASLAYWARGGRQYEGGPVEWGPIGRDTSRRRLQVVQ